MRGVLGCLVVLFAVSCSSTPSYPKIESMYYSMFKDNGLYEILGVRINDATKVDDITYVAEATVAEKMKIGVEDFFKLKTYFPKPGMQEQLLNADLGTQLGFLVGNTAAVVGVMTIYGSSFKAGDVFTREIRITLTKKDSGWQITHID